MIKISLLITTDGGGAAGASIVNESEVPTKLEVEYLAPEKALGRFLDCSIRELEEKAVEVINEPTTDPIPALCRQTHFKGADR